jgi:Protein of unknown function (DUF1236)
MISRFMMSVAATALIAGTGFAHAQGSGTNREAPAVGSPVQQGTPPSDRAGSSATPRAPDAAEATTPLSGSKAAQSEQKSPAAGHKQRAEDNMQGQKSKGMRSGMNDNSKGGSREMKAEGREDHNGMKAEGKAEGRRDHPEMKAEGRNHNNKAEGAAEHRSQTVGQAGAGAKLSGEQRTKITTVIREQHVQPLAHVNFSISVGARVPRDVRFHPLPAEILVIYPDWRGYEFILVGDQIVVVNPRTLEIVAVMDA